jgi:hypothetical protein
MRLLLISYVALFICGLAPFLTIFCPAIISPSISLQTAIVFGALYLILNLFTLKDTHIRILKNKEQRFNYIPFKLYVKKIIFMSFFIFATIVFSSKEINLYGLLPLIITFSVTDLLRFILGLGLGHSYLAFNDKSILFHGNSVIKINEENLSKVVYRFENFYFILKNGKTITINPDFFELKHRKQALENLHNWLNINKIDISKA